LPNKPTAPAPRDEWTLIRGARQLLTLHGPSGPRRGSAMNELATVTDGALLIHNGIIQDAGPARRVENLTQARQAKEIGASGRIVMPAFVDPAAVLVFPPPDAKRVPERAKQPSLQVLSQRVLSGGAGDAVSAWARCGVLTVGAHTGYAHDLRNTVKVLRIHQSLQSKPLRIRSILSPRTESGAENAAEVLIHKWLPAIRKRRLAVIFEMTRDHRELAIAAAGLGYSLRIRADDPLPPRMLAFAVEAGAVAILAPPAASQAGSHIELLRALGDMGCVHVIQGTEALRGDREHAPALREEIDEGVPLALASGFEANATVSFNPQFLLWQAVTRFEEAIVAATYNAACSLRLSHVAGSLAPGKAADVLLMDVPDYRDLVRRVGHNDVELVLRAGRPVYRRSPLILD